MKQELRWRLKGFLALFALLLFYISRSVQHSAHKLLWFDELCTLNVVTQPTLARMFLAEAPDANPPLLYLLIRASVHVFGVNAFALRLPSLCATVLAIVCVYVFVVRRFGQPAALLGAALFLFSPACDYGVEARPYGLLLGLTALTLVFWQAAVKPDRRVGPLIGLGIAVFAATITHPFGIFWAAVPVFAGEGVRWWRTRRLDAGILTAMLLGFSGFAITLYFGAKTHTVLLALTGGRYPAISLPTVGRLFKAFRWDGSLRAFELLLPTGAALLYMKRRGRPREGASQPGAPAHEWVAVAALVLNAFAVYLFTVVATHYFWPRYLLPSVLGYFLLLACTCGALNRKPVMLVVFAAGFLLMPRDGGVLSGLLARQRSMRRIEAPGAALLASADPGEPIVIENAVQYPQTWWYSSPEQRARLHYVADVKQAMPGGDFMGDAVLIAIQEAGSALYPTDTLPGFLATHKSFLLFRGQVTNGSWFGDFLRAHGYRLLTVASDGDGNTLWRVSAPDDPMGRAYSALSFHRQQTQGFALGCYRSRLQRENARTTPEREHL